MFKFLNPNQKGYQAALDFRKLPASKLTPLMLCEAFNAPVLLESAFLKSGKGRFSILILQEAFRVVKENQETTLLFGDFKHTLPHNPFLKTLQSLRNLAPNPDDSSSNSSSDCALPSDLPLPLGGVGYLGYEFFSEIESLEFHNPPLYDCYDNAFIFGRDFAVFDHFYESLYLISVAYEDEIQAHNLQSRLDSLTQKLENLQPSQKSHQSYDSKILSHDKQSYFTHMVTTLKDEIYKGNLLQCVPSQSMQIQSNLPPLKAYQNLRTNNPSPYMYYYNFGHFQIIGSSPEVLVKVEKIDAKKARITLRPIAGTRKRGDSQSRDLQLEEELKNNEKENAEHLMLLDLGRNDIGKVAIGGSVEVTQEKVIEKYARVMHLVSEVEGIMDLQIHDKEDAIIAAFPAGTVSGAPKIQAIKTLESLEEHKRGIYAGAIGYFTQDGDMNFAIAIRTAVYQKGVYYLQAGAGIVYDSKPKEEYLETQNKMLSLIEAIMGENNAKNTITKEAL